MEQFGDYFLLEKIASGGMADIYKAVKIGARGFRKYSAVKRILPHICEDKSIRDMFVKEAHVLSSINHPNIVQIHDLGEQDGQFFIVMDFIKGKDLKTLLFKHLPYDESMPPELMFYILGSIADGLEHAHNLADSFGRNLNIVHRDINPNNIFLSYSGEVKIIDFGVVKADTDDNKTKTGIIKGKISYLSPEQLEGKRVDKRTDIFAIGLIFYEMVARKKLFDGKTEVETLKQLLNLDIDEKIDLLALEKPLADILKKLLCRDETKRYQTAGRFKLDLQKYLTEKGILISAQPLRDCMHHLFAEAIDNEQKDQAHYDSLITTGVYQTDLNSGGPGAIRAADNDRTKFAGPAEQTRIKTVPDSDRTKVVPSQAPPDDASRFAGDDERTRFASPEKTAVRPAGREPDDDATRFVGLDDDKTQFVSRKDAESTRVVQTPVTSHDRKSGAGRTTPSPSDRPPVFKRPLVLISLGAALLLVLLSGVFLFKDGEQQPPVVPQPSPEIAREPEAKPAPQATTQTVAPAQPSSQPELRTAPQPVIPEQTPVPAAVQPQVTAPSPSITTKPDTAPTPTPPPTRAPEIVSRPEPTPEPVAPPTPEPEPLSPAVSAQQPQTIPEPPTPEPEEPEPVTTTVEPTRTPSGKILPERTKKDLTGQRDQTATTRPSVPEPTPAPVMKPERKPATPIEQEPSRDKPALSSKNVNMYALLKMTGSPDGQILFINGDKQGPIPITLALPPGFYDIECKRDGYKSYKAGIRIRRGQTLNMECLLKPE